MTSLLQFFREITCRHQELKLSATFPAIVEEGTVMMAAVEIRCQRCGEFWHADLDATGAVCAALGMDEPQRESALRLA